MDSWWTHPGATRRYPIWDPSAGFTLFERWISISPEEDVLAGMTCVADARKSLVRLIMFGKD